MVFDFGERLKQLREARSLSQQQVADWLNMNRNTISGYENNTITPSLEVAIRLAGIYRTTLDYIVGLNDRAVIALDDFTTEQQEDVQTIIQIYKKACQTPDKRNSDNK